MIPVVVGSSSIGHPSFAPRKWRTPALGARLSVRPAVAALFSAALAQVEVNARGVTQSTDPEFLHQLRVGLRRLRTVQRAFRIPGTKRRLSKFKPALAAARDWDVFCGWLESASISLELRALARRKRAAARRRAHSALASRAFGEFLRRGPLSRGAALSGAETYSRSAGSCARSIRKTPPAGSLTAGQVKGNRGYARSSAGRAAPTSQASTPSGVR